MNIKHSLGIGALLLLSLGCVAANAAQFSVKDYGAKGDGVTDDDNAIKSAVAAAMATNAGNGNVVYFPGGTYCLKSGASGGAHIEINNANGLTLQGDTTGNGVTLLSGDANKSWIHIANSSNCNFYNFKMDLSILQFTQGTITSIDQTAHTVTVAVDSGYPAPNRADLTQNQGTIFRVFTDPSATYFDQKYEPTIVSRVQNGAGQWVIGLSAQPPASFAGKKFVVWAPYGGAGFDMVSDSGILVQDCAYYGGGGGTFFYTSGCAGTITMRRVYAGPPPGSNRLLVAGNGSQQTDCRCTLVLDSCDFSRSDDNLVNMLTGVMHILSKPGAATIQVYQHGYMVGDKLSIWDWTLNQTHERSQAMITAIDTNADGTQNLHLDHDVQIVKTGPPPSSGGNDAVLADGIDRVMDFNTAGKLLCTNCRFSGGRAEGVVSKAPNSDFENCTFHGNRMHALEAAVSQYYGEGPQIVNLTVRNCTFEDCDSTCLMIGGGSTASRDNVSITIQGNTFKNCGRHDLVLQDDIGIGVRLVNVNGATISGNTFDNMPSSSIAIQYSTNVQITNNVFRNTQQEPTPVTATTDSGAIVWMDHSSNITLSGNTVNNIGPYETFLAEATSSCTNITGLAGGLTQSGDQGLRALNAFAAGFYRLSPTSFPNSALDVNTGSPNDGTAVQVFGSNGSSAQRWYLQAVTGGYSRLTPAVNFLSALDISGSGTADPTPIDEWTSNGSAAQQWSITSLNNGAYRLIPRINTGAALSAPSDSSQVFEKAWNNSTNEQWTPTFVGFGDPLFRSSFETADLPLTWTNTIDFSANVTGYLAGLSPECALRANGDIPGFLAHTGGSALMYSGSANGGAAYCYCKVFDLSANPLTIQNGTTLSYWIYPRQDNGRYVGVDFHCTDGSTLRDSRAVDLSGVSMHPNAGHGGAIALNAWTQIQCNLDYFLLGKTVDKIWIAFDRSGATGQYRGYIDDIAFQSP